MAPSRDLTNPLPGIAHPACQPVRVHRSGCTLAAVAITAASAVHGTAGHGAAGHGAPAYGAAAGSDVVRASERPNIVWIMTDDQTRVDLKWMPLTRDRIGHAGVTFTDALAPNPVC